MTDFANLVLASDTTGLLKAEDALNDVAVAARRTETAVKTSAAGSTAALRTVGTAGAAAAGGFSLAGNGARMMGMQLSQVGQQTMASGNFLQALAIQLPDIGLAFGTVGIAAGLLAGIALPLLGKAFGLGAADAKSFSDALDITKETLGQIESVLGSVSGLEDQYRTAIESGNIALGERIQHLIDLRIKEAEYMALDLPGQIREQEAAQRDLASAAADAGRQLAYQVQITQDALEGNNARYFEDMLAVLGDARVEYEQLTVQADLAANRTGQMTDELAIANGALDEAKDSANRMADGVAMGASAAQTALNYINAMAGGLSNAAAAAGGLETSLWGAANAAANAAQNIYAAMQQQVALRSANAGTGGVFGAISAGAAQLVQRGGEAARAMNPLRLNLRAVAVAANGGGGGGGGSGGAAGAVNDLSNGIDDALDIILAGADAAKKYADTMQGYFVDGVGSAVDYMVGGFKDGMSGLWDIFTGTIKQMVAFAIKNRIMIALGMGGSAAGTAATAAPAAGGGMLSGIGTALAGVGTAFAGGLSSVVTGLFTSGFAGAGAAISTAVSGAVGGGVAGFAAAAGAIALPLLAVAGIFMAFKKKTELLDSGLKITVGNMDALVQQFETIKTSRFFGLSNNTSTNTSGAGKEVSDPITKAYADIRQSVKEMAGALGVGGKAFKGFSASFQVSLKGLSQDQVAAAIQAEFSKISDQLAGMAGIAKRFRLEGEGATAALTRLSSSLVSVNAVFDRLGFTMLDTSIAGGALAARIVAIFGGIENLGAAAQSYFENFYTLAERTSAAGQQFRDSFRDLGITGAFPKTIEEFRANVEKLQASGRKLAAAKLISLAPLFQELMGLRNEFQTEAFEKQRDAAEAAARAMEESARRAQAMADALKTDQFRTLFDYERAVGRTRAGVPFAAPVTIPQTPVAQADATKEAKADATNKTTEQLLMAIYSALTALKQNNRKWDREGLPPARPAL